MDSKELRLIVLHILKTYPDNSSLSVAGVLDNVQRFGVNKGIYPQHTGQYRGGFSPSSEILMPLEDREKVRQILWQLIIEGVLVPSALHSHVHGRFIERQAVIRGQNPEFRSKTLFFSTSRILAVGSSFRTSLRRAAMASALSSLIPSLSFIERPKAKPWSYETFLISSTEWSLYFL